MRRTWTKDGMDRTNVDERDGRDGRERTGRMGRTWTDTTETMWPVHRADAACGVQQKRTDGTGGTNVDGRGWMDVDGRRRNGRDEHGRTWTNRLFGTDVKPWNSRNRFTIFSKRKELT